MPRDIGLYVEDMIEASTRLATYTRGLDFDAFANDSRTVDAVVRNLEILGEAAKQIPVATRERVREIDWRKVAGMRDVLAHAYFQIDLRIVWDVAINKIPQLVAPLRQLLADLGRD